MFFSFLPAVPVLVPPAAAEEVGRILGAFTRAALMSGALQHILAITVEYARERIQFGRAIGQFQAVKQELAILAGECAAAQTASDAAAAALDAAEGGEALAVAVAKMRVGEAAGRGSKVAHQVHGAIGFTHEHELHYRTRRLWAWRDEIGSETVDLQPGDTFVLFTDGVSEAFDGSGELFGEDRLLAQLASTGGSARETTQGVLDAVRQHAAGARQSDDITVLSVHYAGPAGAARPAVVQSTDAHA